MKPVSGGNRGGSGGNRGGSGGNRGGSGGNRGGIGGNRGGSGGHYVWRVRKPSFAGQYVVRGNSDVAHSDHASSGIGLRNTDISSIDGVTEKFTNMSTDHSCWPNPVTHGIRNLSPNKGSSKLGNVSEVEIQTPESLVLSGVHTVYGNKFTVQNSQSQDQDEESQSSSCLSSTPLVYSADKKNEPFHTVDSGFKDCQTPRDFRSGVRGNRGSGRHYGSRGRTPPSACHYGTMAHSDDALPGVGRRNTDITSVDVVTEKFNNMSTDNGNLSPNNGSSKLQGNVSEVEILTPEPLVQSDVDAVNCNDFTSSTVQNFQSRDVNEEIQSASCLNSTSEGMKNEPFRTGDSSFKDFQTPRDFLCENSTSEGTSGKDEIEKSDFQENLFSYDICVERNKSIPRLKSSLFNQNRATRSEMKRRAQGDKIKTLRHGMILLKGYISLKDQIKLIKTCQELGRGHGGFYQPGYRDGAKLHLKMMCLGRNWDPETSMYSDKRPIDDSTPPSIPDEFRQLIKGALQECHSYLESYSKDSKVTNVRDILPSMSPNICIVNFYTKSGKLGLHQDKDESEESLSKGLPVVSFSLGDTAEFLFGDRRDVDKADKVELESGDVLIFGGKSRLIYHGVSIIKPETAPRTLLEETNLRPGRLNLTFREY